MAAARQLLVAALLSGDDSASSNASPSTTGQPPLVTTDHAQALLEAVFSASPDHASSSGGVGSDSSYDTDLLQVAERAGKLLLQTTTSTSTTKRALNVQSACSMIQLVIRARPNLCCARYAAWCTAVLPMLTRNNPTSSVPSITDTLILLFEACVSRQDLVRDVVAVHLPKFIQALLDHARTPLAVSAAMRMTHAFSSIVKPLAGKLQKWAGEGLVELGDITDVEGADQTEALRCGALLMELVNCSGKQACEAAFAKRVLRLVVTVHELLDQLYAAVDEEPFKRPVDETAINIPKLSRDYLESTPALLTLYRRIMGVTVAALNRTYIGPVGVPLQELVDLLQRVFHLNRFCVVCRSCAYCFSAYLHVPFHAPNSPAKVR